MYDEQQDNRACAHMPTGVKTRLVVLAAYSSFSSCFRWLLSWDSTLTSPRSEPPRPSALRPVPVRSALPPRAAEGGRSPQEPPRPASLPPPLRLRSTASVQTAAVALLYFTEIYVPHPVATLTELSPFPCARSAMSCLSHSAISSLFLRNIHKSQHNRWDMEHFNPLASPATPLAPQHHPSSCCQAHTAVWHAPLSTNTSLPSSNLSGSTRGVSRSPHSFWATPSVITVFQGPFPLAWQHNPEVQTTAIISSSSRSFCRPISPVGWAGLVLHMALH